MHSHPYFNLLLLICLGQFWILGLDLDEDITVTKQQILLRFFYFTKDIVAYLD